jgi:hypothetical protein
LTGFSQCGCCGSGFIVKSRAQSNDRRFSYACAGYHERGPAVCRNARGIPLAEGDGIALEALLDDVLDEDMIRESVDEALDVVLADAPTDRAFIETQLAQLEEECVKLVSAAAARGQVAGLVRALQEREAQKATLRAELAGAGSQHRLQASEATRVRRELSQLADDWRGVLVNDPANARPIVSKLLTGRVTFTPLEERGHWEMTAGER